MKPSTGATVRLHRNAVRLRPESVSAFKRNHCPQSPESAAYDSYRRKEAAAIFESLPADERQEIDNLARQAAASFDGSLANAMYRTKCNQITSERHNDRIKNFVDWEKSRAA
jgi:hypothetical protein